MAIPVNIEDLLGKRKVESNRIEFKSGWNPKSIYHTICAFANDFDNIGGGYIIVGVEEFNGIAQRPVKGIPIDQLDKIQQEMQQFNQLFVPYYAAKISVEEIDGQQVLVIWVPSGLERPYTIPSDVTAKVKMQTPYIRYGTSSIEAKGAQLNELREMANRIPFDDRGNPQIELADLSPVLIKDYLQKVGSKINEQNLTDNLPFVLEQMDLVEGPKERRLVKNVAAMMFCEHPEKFFKTTQVDIVIFPEGKVNNPDNIIEAPTIKGDVPSMIRSALTYIRTNVIKEKIVKQKDDEHSLRFFNYPYQAIEEAVVNALYHRDYSVREPVEITIEPERISILSFSGPDHSISDERIKEAKDLRSRRYRNRRLGEFLRELDLTEGRATGIPTIQQKLRQNGSNPACIETDEERSFFLIDIPCHPDFADEKLSQVEPTENKQDKNFVPSLVPSLSQVLSQVEEEDIMLAVKVLTACTEERDIQYLQTVTGEANRTRLRKNIVRPLIDSGLIGMTIPDKPTSSKQKYKITEKGEKLLN